MVPLMSNKDFQRSFRLTRATFDQPVMRLGPKVANIDNMSVVRHTLSADKQPTMVALRTMANHHPYRLTLFHAKKNLL